jgi:restriction endonuclease SmaI-like protein
MELGKGNWTNEADLEGLRERMMQHMQAYERIFSLRCVSAGSSLRNHYEYELVEIPKALLRDSINHPVRMMHESKQTPKSGYCTVVDEVGDIKFELYFDGGTERKLQIKRIQKVHCVTHASWGSSSVAVRTSPC